MRKALVLLTAMFAPALLTTSAPADVAAGHGIRVVPYDHAPLGEINAYRPAGEPRGVVLLLSDRDGWTRPMDEMARDLARRDLLVAGVSSPALIQAMETAKRRCANPNYPLIDLTRDVQRRMAVARYMKPVLVGRGLGATLAYAGAAQWRNGGYQGAVSINPVAVVPGRKAWCGAPGFAAWRSRQPQGWTFGANRQVTTNWTVLAQAPGATLDNRKLLHFVSMVPHASLIRLPGSGASEAGAAQLRTRTAAAIEALLPPPIPPAQAGQAAIPDMPLTLVPAAPGTRSDMMAIAWSGDGGWVGIDRDLSAQIARAGIPVVGIDSLSYFWSARTPHGAGRDLNQLIRAFGQRWGKRRVILVGYSFGADVLPHMIGALDPDVRARIAGVTLLGLSPTAAFQFHVTSWLDMASSDALPTLPAVRALRGLSIRCVRGSLETGSACPTLPAGLAQQYVVPGGHHFGRNAPLLANIVLGRVRPGRIIG